MGYMRIAEEGGVGSRDAVLSFLMRLGFLEQGVDYPVGDLSEAQRKVLADLATRQAGSGLLVAPLLGSPASSRPDPPGAGLLHALREESPSRSDLHERRRCQRQRVPI